MIASGISRVALAVFLRRQIASDHVSDGYRPLQVDRRIVHGQSDCAGYEAGQTAKLGEELDIGCGNSFGASCSKAQACPFSMAISASSVATRAARCSFSSRAFTAIASTASNS